MDDSEGEGKFKRDDGCRTCISEAGQGSSGKTPRVSTQAQASVKETEGGSAKAKLNRYQAAQALKNDLTPREDRARCSASAQTSVAQDPAGNALHPGWLDGLVLRHRASEGWVRCGGLASARSRHCQGNWGRRVLEALRCRGGAAPEHRIWSGLPGRRMSSDCRDASVGFADRDVSEPHAMPALGIRVGGFIPSWPKPACRWMRSGARC